MDTATCPHCGEQYPSHTIGAHAARCISNPRTRSAIMATLEHPRHAGYAVVSPVYDDAARDTGAPLSKALFRRYGTWENVIAAFGLQPLPRKWKARKAKGTANKLSAAVDAEINSVKAIVAEVRTYERRRGLPVCGVRELPDGRLAWMVR